MGHGMQVPEKSKRGLKGVLCEMFTYSENLKVPMLIAMMLAAAGAVLTIIGPSQLRRITALIAEGLLTSLR